MRYIREKIYFHLDDETVCELKQKAEDNNFNNTNYLKYLGHEVEIIIQINEDGSNKIISINNKNIWNKDISI